MAIEKFWIVWNENPERCDFPTHKHLSGNEAIQEAERLARINRGSTFSVMQLVGSVRTKEVEWQFPSDLPL